MTNLTRIVSLLLVVIMAVVIAAPAPQPALAQGDDCPDSLAAEDCELLAASSAAMFAAGTFSISEYALTLQLRADGETIALNTSGNGVVEFSESNLLQMDVSFAPATGTSAEGETTGDGAIKLNNDGVWLGIGEAGTAPDNLDWAGLLFQDGMTEMGDMDMLGDMFGDLGIDPDFDASFVTTTRGDDTEFNGETVAVFNTDISGAQFLRSSLVNQLLTSLAVTALQDAELDPSLAAILITTVLDTFATDLEETSTIRFTQYISPETNFVTYVGAEIDLNIDLSLLADFAEDVPSAGLGIAMDFNATLDAHGDPVTVAAPDEFDDLTADFEELVEDVMSGDLFGDMDLGLGFDSGPGTVGASDITPEAADFTIAIGESAEGTLTPEDDRDLYAFEGTAGQTIEIAMRSADTNALDTTIELYSANSVLLVQNDDAPGTAPAEYELDIYDSYMTFELPEDGTYVLVAESLFSMSSPVDYTLFIEVVE